MDKYLQYLKDWSADGQVIRPDCVVTAPWTLYKCKFGCSMYGKSYCCPPNTPNYRQTREILDSYQTAILFHTHELNTTEIAAFTVRELFLDGYYKAIAFGSGPCHICKTCGLSYCRLPDKALPSMEGCGIDVFATARAAGYEINVLRDKEEQHNHFGLLLVE